MDNDILNESVRNVCFDVLCLGIIRSQVLLDRVCSRWRLYIRCNLGIFIITIRLGRWVLNRLGVNNWCRLVSCLGYNLRNLGLLYIWVQFKSLRRLLGLDNGVVEFQCVNLLIMYRAT